ncbi:MAG: hypothetical protein ACTSPN_10040 [Promethearchaeota archaeon]
MYFLIKYKKQHVQVKNSQDIGFSALFYGISHMRLFVLIADYYPVGTVISPFLIWSSGSFRFLFLNLGLLSINLGFLLFTYYMEKNKKFFFKNYFFTSCFSIQTIILVIIVLFDLFGINYLSILSLPLFILFLLIYIKDFDNQIKKEKIYLRGSLKLGFAILLILSSYILSLDVISSLLGIISRLIENGLQLIAIGLLFGILRNLVPFFEFDWRDKIENIYIINKAGINLYSKSYTEETKSIDDHYISGVLSSVNIMLNELMNAKDNKISIIEKKNKIVTIYSSEFIIGVLVSTEELEYFKHNLKKLVLKIEVLYKNLLINWKGDRSKFSPLKDIFNDIFPM